MIKPNLSSILNQVLQKILEGKLQMKRLTTSKKTQGMNTIKPAKMKGWAAATHNIEGGMPTHTTQQQAPTLLTDNSQHGWSQFWQQKINKLTERIQTQDLSCCCIQETHVSIKDGHHLRVKDGKGFSLCLGQRLF